MTAVRATSTDISYNWSALQALEADRTITPFSIMLIWREQRVKQWTMNNENPSPLPIIHRQ